MILFQSIFTVFTLSILLLLSIVGFHILTQFVFTPVLELEQFTLRALSQFASNPALILFYLIPVTVHMLLSGCSIVILSLFRDNVKLLDVFLMSIFPIVISFSYNYGKSLMNLCEESQESIDELKCGLSYASSTFANEVFETLSQYFLNTVFLFLGGCIALFILKSFAK
jgi:hypothetical protein